MQWIDIKYLYFFMTWIGGNAHPNQFDLLRIALNDLTKDVVVIEQNASDVIALIFVNSIFKQVHQTQNTHVIGRLTDITQLNELFS